MTGTRDLEAGVIGTMLMSPRAVDVLRSEEHLKPEHFASERLGVAFSVMCGLRDRGEDFDSVLIRSELARIGDPDPGRLVNAALSMAAASTVKEYTRRIVAAAGWRTRERVLADLQNAARSQDAQAWGAAMSQLDRSPTRKRGLTADEWGRMLDEVIDPDKPAPAVIPLPWPALNEPLDGGLWPGDYVVIAGWTNHGKSICADMIADNAALHGHKAHLYLAEMTPQERGRRLLARHTGVPMRRIKRRRFQEGDLKKLVAVTSDGQMPYGCTPVADWTIEEVCADIRRAGWAVAVIDGMHDFPYRDERDLDHISRTIYRTAKATGTTIVALAHLNERMSLDHSVKRPRPGMQAIKGASSIKQQADLVGFVWQEDDELGLPSGSGSIWFAKGRNSDVGSVDVQLDNRMRLLTREAA